MRSASREPAWFSVWLGLGLIGYAVLAYQTAWLSDDAFISLRTVSNLLAGYGPRWNVGERVQTFTHPLWMFLLTAAHAITGEPFYSTLYLSWLVSCTAAWPLSGHLPVSAAETTGAPHAAACACGKTANT